MNNNMENNKNGKSVILILFLIIALLSTAFFFLESASAKKELEMLKNKQLEKSEEAESYQEQVKELTEKVESLNEVVEKSKETEKETEEIADDDSETETENEDDTEVAVDTPKPVRRDYEFSAKEIRKLSETSGYKGKKIAFLTFDDGPNHEITPGVLDVLKSKGAHATFFMVGNRIGPGTADVVHRVIHEGHAIATHSFSHDYDYLYPDRNPNPDAVVGEYHKSMRALKDILGEDFDTKVFRYPGGHLSWREEGLQRTDEALANEGVAWIDWNTMNGDAQMEWSDNPNEVIRPTTVEEAVHNFDKSTIFTSNPDIAVILMHDAPDKHLTLEALPALIDHLIELGYEFGTLI